MKPGEVITRNEEIELNKDSKVTKIKISNANYGNIDAIAFSSKGTPLGDIIMNHSGSLLHFAGVIKKNDWQGNKAVQFHIRDLFTA